MVDLNDDNNCYLSRLFCYLCPRLTTSRSGRVQGPCHIDKPIVGHDAPPFRAQ